MRAGEICALQKDDVVGRVARLRMTKNGLPRDVALSPRAVELWAMVPDGFELTRMVGHRDIRQFQIHYNATADDLAAKL